MKNLAIPILTTALLGGCSATGTPAPQDSASEMPEYTTGSNLAQKSRGKPKDVKIMSAPELEEAQTNSTDPVR